jgi:SAM-dependent methyltransferase
MKEFQNNLSKITPALLDGAYKKPKVDKLIAVLKSAGVIGEPGGLALDLGCSGGFFCEGLAPYFDSVIGVDIDEEAIDFARQHAIQKNIHYLLISDDKIPAENDSLDLIVCNHVYEHVPDAEKLFMEIERTLRVGGICYLGAASRLTVIEPHFKLPFLSWLPKPLANRYMRWFGKGDYYYEKLRTYWGIKRLIQRFDVQDFTLDIIKKPMKYCATDMISPNGLLPRLPIFFLRTVYPFLPSYIFLLRRRDG